MEKVATNKLSIHLIKPEYSTAEDIFKESDKLTKELITDVGDLYYGDSHVVPPPWVAKFFGTSFENTQGDSLKLFTASSKATLLVVVDHRTFAIVFGYGHTLMKPGVWEERFGLKVALSVIDADNLRSIDKKNMSIVPKLSKEQMTKDGTFADFGIDVEQDLIQGITAKSKDEEFGKTVTGKDALSVSVKKDIASIKEFLKKCLQKYNSDEYKKDFGWIDHVSEIKAPQVVSFLDGKLVENIKTANYDKTWMAIPEIVPWEDVSEFKYKDHTFGDDIDAPTYLGFLSDDEKEHISVETLKNHVVDYVSASTSETAQSWKVYNCLYCEIVDNGKTYILSNGKWYQIDANFAKQVSDSFETFKSKPADVVFPECKKGEHEDKYNDRVAKEISDACNMDRKTINHGGANQKIEFCDLFTKDKKLIHVKHYGASSVLSHLFSQGLVSGELFIRDQEFRTKLNKKLPNGHKLSNVAEKPRAAEYKIVYAIISKSNSDLDIPFFSKVNMRNAVQRLETFGYSVSLQKISTSSTGSV